ncbi:hypothetical protein CoNPh26_CDS0031 [Staphylococcus phage S-CoN_Ph26]|nr:hypothetical protein CoNPh26_CDS0031 [Staphylococcus phage S-CoN_Ph26]
MFKSVNVFLILLPLPLFKCSFLFRYQRALSKSSFFLRLARLIYLIALPIVKLTLVCNL